MNALQSMQCTGFEAMHSNVQGTSTKVLSSLLVLAVCEQPF